MFFVIKFWETFLKSKSTKKRFISSLVSRLSELWLHNVKITNSYLLVESDDITKLDSLKKIFWVQKIDIIQSFNTDMSDIDSVIKEILAKIKENYKDVLSSVKTFRISAKRENKKFWLKSPEIQRELWKKLELEFPWLKANYKNFDIEIKVRIMNDSFWLWTSIDEENWVWWLPYWIEWKALNLFSWWIDSPVATFLAAKRWIKQDFLFLNIPASDLLLQQVYKIYEYLKWNYWITWKFYEIRINNEIKQIKKIVPSWTRQIVFKYFLYRISDLLAKYFKVPAIINWENLWQVSTQTLTNMALLDSVSDRLILRPVLTFDKVEIMDFAKQIWTYDLSIQIKETCSLEEHSNSRVKSIDDITFWYNKLWFDEKQILNNLAKIDNVPDFDFFSLKTNEVKWNLIDLDKESSFNLLEENIYTFTCSSGYKASQAAYEWSRKWYKTYWKVNN